MVSNSIDDFGSGNASLRELGQLPIDTLKIDGSLVRDIATDARQGQLAAAIVTLAHSLQLRVVAEGVESREQLAFLRGAGCDEVQGFYIGKPMSGAELEARLVPRAALTLANQFLTFGASRIGIPHAGWGNRLSIDLSRLLEEARIGEVAEDGEGDDEHSSDRRWRDRFVFHRVPSAQ